MPFKALNHQRKEETGHFYTYSHTTKHLTLLTKSKRSQSALEYMMTYGWAILIIIIVAVILYSMGIFNPSSSVTFTSSGFAPFTVSSSLCNNLGYKIAVIAGPIPNNANSLAISKVFLTSATGANTTTASYTLKSPISLTSGKTATILIPNVACPSAGIHYSLSASIQYSYSTTAGNVVENTTGTVAGTSIAGKPSVLTTYEPLTITNSQSTATPNPFQQMLVFNSTDPGWTSISTSNFGQNVEFFYYNGTIIPSWLENYTADNATWWLKIAAIPAGSSETVYVGFVPSTTNLFNTVNDGEAPQIPCGSTPTSSCSNYAEYDDGANVFYDYVNFKGTSLPSTYYVTSNGGLYSVDNGIYLSDYFLSSDFSFNSNYAIYGTLKFSASGPVASFNSRIGYVDQGDNFIQVAGNSGGVSQYIVNYNGSTFNMGSPTFYNLTKFLGLWTTHFATYGMVGSAIYTNNKDFTFKNSLTGVTVQALYTNATVEIYDLMIGGVPPNGIIPSISVG